MYIGTYGGFIYVITIFIHHDIIIESPDQPMINIALTIFTYVLIMTVTIAKKKELTVS